MAYLAIDATRYSLSFRLGRYEFFAQRKASPFYCDPLFDCEGKRPSVAYIAVDSTQWVERILVVPFFAFHLINHGKR